MDQQGAPAFGDLLRRFRLAAALTQQELAERAGLSARAVSDIERGVKSRPHRATISLLAAALHLTELDRAALEGARGRKSGPLPEQGPLMGAVTPGTHGEILPPLVGRARELALLARHLAGEGPPFLLFTGEPGIGKSRLLREARERAQGAGWRVLEGTAQRRGGQEPFTPLLEALKGYLQRRSPAELRMELRGCAWLVRLLPELAAGPIEPLRGWTVSPEQERRLMFDAVVRLVGNVAGPMGTLLLLDDLQWASADALDLLATLLRSHVAAPVRVLATYRDTDVQPADVLSMLLVDLAREGHVTQRSLTPLTAEEAGQLLDGLFTGQAGAARALRSAVLQRASGVPFFVVSCAQGLREVDSGAGSADVPWDITQSIRQRVAALPEVAREVLDAAAIIGRVAPPNLLLAVVAEPEREVLAALRQVSRARLLVEEEHRYRFTHDLIREVVEAAAGPAQRQVLHRRVAAALEQSAGEPAVELLAYHYGLGGMPEKAVLYLEKAGDHAWARHANAAAQDYYSELVDAADQLGRPLDIARALEKLGTVLRTLARYDAALLVLDRAAETYRAAGDMESLGRTMAQIGLAHSFRGRPSEGIARLEPIRATLETLAPSAGLAALHDALADLYLYGSGSYDLALAAAQRAAEVAHTFQALPILAQARQHQGVALAWLGRTEDGLRVLDEASTRAEGVGDLHALCDALVLSGYINIYRAAFAVSTGQFERAVTTAAALGDPGWIALTVGYHGIPALFIGRWAEARTAFERGVALSRQMDTSIPLPWTLVWRGQLRLWAGEWEAARQDLEEEYMLLDRNGDLHLMRQVQALLAEHDLLAGHPAAARARLVPLLDHSGMEDLAVTLLLPILAWAELELGDVAAAIEVVEQAVRRARSQALPLALVDALRVQAMVSIRQGQWEGATQALEEGITLAQGMPYPYAEGRFWQVYGEMQVQQGSLPAAQARLEAALVIYRRLDARKDIERTEQLLATLG